MTTARDQKQLFPNLAPFVVFGVVFTLFLYVSSLLHARGVRTVPARAPAALPAPLEAPAPVRADEPPTRKTGVDGIFPASGLVTAANLLPIAAFGAIITLFLCVPSLRQADLLPFAAVGLLAGLPHGAVDLFLELGPAGVPRGRTLLGQLVLYLVVVGAVLAVILVAPVPGVGLFLAISLWHFGSSETAFNACRRGEIPTVDPAETITYGLPLVVLPFLIWTDQVRSIIDPLGGAGVTTALAGAARVVMILAIPIVLYTVLRKAKNGHWRDIGELAVLWTGATVLPPLASFSLYFALWHSWRHIIRTLPQLPANRPDLRGGRLVACLLRYGLYTLPGTLGAVVLFIGLLAINQDASLADLRPATWIGAFLAALTVPHAVAIFRYDLWLRTRRSQALS